jgi:hypothetical protein
MKKILPLLFLLVGFTLQAQTPSEETGIIRIYETEAAMAGQCDGTITVEAEGSAGPFWLRVFGPDDFGVIADDFEGESIVEGLCPGDYTVIVTNAYACEVELQTSIPCALSFQEEIDHACSAGGGRISLSPEAGATPIAYQWTGPDGFTATTAEITGLSSGTYSLSATDANGCTAEASYTVSPEGLEVAWPYIKQLTVFAAREGVLTRIYDGQWVRTGPGCLRYAGGAIDVDDDLYAAMRAGEVQWRFEVEAGRPLANLTLSALALPAVELVPISEGRIWIAFMSPADVAAAIGADGFHFPLVLTGQDMDGNVLLDFRASSPELRDCVQIPFLQNNCQWSETPSTGTDQVHVLERRCLQVAPLTDPLNPMVGVEVSGGSGAYTYRWQDENGNILGTDNTQQVGKSGRYCVRIADVQQKCLREVCIDFCLPDELQPKDFLSITAPCGNQGDGGICLTGQAGSWVMQGADGNYYDCLENLRAGNHLVRLVNLSCDGLVEEVEMYIPDQGPAPSIRIADAAPACPGGNNGQICIDISRGVGPYEILWENGQTGPCLTQLSEGQCYSLTVTDQCGAQTTACLELPAYTLPQIDRVVVNEECGGGATSSATVYVSGGKAPYSYFWNNTTGSSYGPTADNTVSPISVGTHNVEVSDGCSNQVVSDNFDVNESPAADFSILPQQVVDACSENDPNGSIFVDVSPVGNYTYEWSNGATSQNLEDVAPGIYYATVVDSDGGCSRRERFEVGIQPLSFDILVGSLSFQLENIEGIPPYAYTWRNEAGNVVGTDPILENVPSGTYCAQVTDARGCAVEKCAELCGDFMPQLAAYIQYPCGPADASGSIEIDLDSYDPGDFAFEWSTGSTLASVDQLLPGSYSVTITYGCAGTIYEYELPDLEQLVIEVTEPCQSGGEAGELQALPPAIGFNNSLQGPNGSWIYTDLAYQWSTGENGPIIYPAGDGIYGLTITSGGCAIERSVSYKDRQPKITVDDWSGPTPIGSDGYINVTLSGGQPPYIFAWYKWDLVGPGKFGWVKISNQEDLTNAEDLSYRLLVVDAGNCSAEMFRNLTTCEDEVWNVEFTPGGQRIASPGGASIHLDIIGIDKEKLTFSWSGPNGFLPDERSDELEGIKTAGEYCVTITDGCGETKVECINLEGHCSGSGVVLSERDARFFRAENRCLDGFLYGLFNGNGKIARSWAFNVSIDRYISPTPSLTHRRFKLIWPDESETVCDCIRTSEFPVNWECTFNGPDEFIVNKRNYGRKDGETLCAQVVDGSGCVSTECFSFSKGKVENLTLREDYIGDYIPDYHDRVGQYTYPIVGVERGCKVCGVDNSPYFNTDCDPSGRSSVELFSMDNHNYEPDDFTNPCKGGGAILVGENTINPVEIRIEQNDHALQYIDYDIVLDREGANNEICIYGGYCLFDPAFGNITTNLKGGVTNAILVKIKVPELCEGNNPPNCYERIEDVIAEECVGALIKCENGEETSEENIYVGSEECLLKIDYAYSYSDECHIVRYCYPTRTILEVLDANVSCDEAQEHYEGCLEFWSPDDPGAIVPITDADSTTNTKPIFDASTEGKDLFGDTRIDSLILLTESSTYRPFPNPFQEAIEVDVHTETQQHVVLKVSNMLGHVVFRRELDLDAGYSRLRLQIPSQHPDGLYALSISSREEQHSWMLMRSR